MWSSGIKGFYAKELASQKNVEGTVLKRNVAVPLRSSLEYKQKDAGHLLCFVVIFL